MSAIGLTIPILQKTPGVVAFTTLTRIYPVAAPQSQTLNRCVLTTATGAEAQMLSGASGMITSRIQVDCICTTATDAANLRKAVIGALKEKKPTYPGILMDCYRDGVEYEDYSDDRTQFRALAGFYVLWRDIPQEEWALYGGYWNDAGYWIDTRTWEE